MDVIVPWSFSLRNVYRDWIKSSVWGTIWVEGDIRNWIEVQIERWWNGCVSTFDRGGVIDIEET